jgi:hypothetical protein
VRARVPPLGAWLGSWLGAKPAGMKSLDAVCTDVVVKIVSASKTLLSFEYKYHFNALDGKD